MASNQSNPVNPPFKTPQPTELQSEETREATLQRVSEQQGAETDVTDDSEEGASGAEDPAMLLENMDHLGNRHILRLDSPPG